MRKFCILIINTLILLTASEMIFSQDVMKKKKLGESRYILNDSTGSYLIKELILPDGTKSYSLIPKSYLYDTTGIEKNLPPSVQDWFYKQKDKRTNGFVASNEAKDSLNYLLSKDDKSDPAQAVTQKKNRAAWWIVGTTTVIGGVVAYIFLKYRKGVDELPIQPDPPR